MNSVNSIAKGQSAVLNKKSENSFNRSWNIMLWNSHFPHKNTLRGSFLGTEYRAPAYPFIIVPYLNLASTVLPQFHTSKSLLYSIARFTDRTYGYTRYWKFLIKCQFSFHRPLCNFHPKTSVFVEKFRFTLIEKYLPG